MNNKINAVFDGGGVKGIGLVGAVSMTEEKGYRFNNVAGTSAGAIVAAFIAAGYTSKEMKEILDNLDYNKFKDLGSEDRIPFIGYVLSIAFQKGIYEGDYFESWIREKLNAKGIYTFADLIVEGTENNKKHKYKLQVIATDISRRKLLVLPEDIKYYGRDPNTLDVAWAVRMSMSIPFFFEPVVLQQSDGSTSYIVDGGVLSNYPIWIFDNQAYPTIGYKLVESDEGNEGAISKIKGPISLFAAMFVTMMEAHDARYITDSNFARTIPIDTLGVKTIDFDITPDKSQSLYLSGRNAAEKFFNQWDFDDYKNKKFVSRSERIKNTSKE